MYVSEFVLVLCFAAFVPSQQKPVDVANITQSNEKIKVNIIATSTYNKTKHHGHLRPMLPKDYTNQTDRKYQEPEVRTGAAAVSQKIQHPNSIEYNEVAMVPIYEPGFVNGSKSVQNEIPIYSYWEPLFGVSQEQEEYHINMYEAAYLSRDLARLFAYQRNRMPTRPEVSAGLHDDDQHLQESGSKLRPRSRRTAKLLK